MSDTEARRRIREAGSQSLFVEAGAGTGKTAELVARAVNLISSGTTTIDRVVAITFTEAAAAELGERLRAALFDVARDSDVPSERARCRAALAGFSAARISTIHSFARSVLASEWAAAGLPPAFEVVDATEASIAFDREWRSFCAHSLNESTGENAAMLERAFALGLHAGHLRLLAQQAHDRADLIERLPEMLPPLGSVVVDGVIEALDAVVAECHNALPGDTLRVFANSKLVPWRAALARANEGDDVDRLIALSGGPSFGDPSRKGSQAKWKGGALEQAREQLNEAGVRCDEQIIAARNEVLHGVLVIVRRFVERFSIARRMAGRLEFNDLLVILREMLRDDAAACGRVAQGISHLLIDEFQDTDALQAEIAMLLADAQGGPVTFFVGDPKQSIYRFRRADIGLYTDVRARQAGDTVLLGESMRSAPEVIDWVNCVFGNLLTGERQVDWQPLAAAQPNRSGTVTVFGGAGGEPIDAIRHTEAEDVVSLASRALAEGWQVTDRAGNKRAARYGDIAVLLPGRTALPALEIALRSAGLPYRIESQSLLWATQEVRDLLSILRAITNPMDQVSIVASLRSAWLGCGDDELLDYRSAGGEWTYDQPSSSLPDDHIVCSGLRRLAHWRSRAAELSTSALIEHLISETDAFPAAFATARPREIWNRLRFVAEQARAFLDSGGLTHAEFLSWCEQQQQERSRALETPVPDLDQDALRLSTIHGAKGLEYPIVCLAGLNAAPAPPSSARLLWRAAGAPEVRIGRKDEAWETEGFVDAHEIDAELSRDEEMRLLYVGATRARDHLLVSLHHRDGTNCAAARIAEAVEAAPCKRLRSVERVDSEDVAPPDESPAIDVGEWIAQLEAWTKARATALERSCRHAFRSATSLAAEAMADDNTFDEPHHLDGRAFGSAVHAVLERLPLPSAENVREVAVAASAECGVSDRADDVESAALAILSTDTMRDAMQSDRWWRELFVGSTVGDVLVEGFIDFVFETPDGLVIVDYKTDFPTEPEREAQLVARYGVQLAAYAELLARATGLPVARAELLFARPGEARSVVIPDLDGIRSSLSHVPALEH